MSQLPGALMSPTATLPTGGGNVVANPAWEVTVNAAHEKAHQGMVKQRDAVHDAGNQVFASVPRPPDTQSY